MPEVDGPDIDGPDDGDVDPDPDEEELAPAPPQHVGSSPLLIAQMAPANVFASSTPEPNPETRLKFGEKFESVMPVLS